MAGMLNGLENRCGGHDKGEDGENGEQVLA